MDLYNAWINCRQDQFIARSAAPEWGIAKREFFTDALSVAKSWGFECVWAKDWRIVDEKPPIVKETFTPDRIRNPGLGLYKSDGWM